MNRELFKYFIARGGYSVSTMAKALGMTRAGLYKKINGETSFKPAEIITIMGMLNLQKDDVWDIFFKNLVNETSLKLDIVIGE